MAERPPGVDLADRMYAPAARVVVDERVEPEPAPVARAAERHGDALGGGNQLVALASLELGGAEPDTAKPAAGVGMDRVGRRELQRLADRAADRDIGHDNAIWLERVFERGLTVCFEPYLHRVTDVAVCGTVGEALELAAPHTIHTDPRGAFRGIRLGPTQLEAGERDQLVTTAERVAVALRRAGYRGRFGLDAFVYDDAGSRRLHPLCEINPRWTFGHVATALGARFASTTLGFGPAPATAKVLIQSTRFTAWVG
jgi:hypothetical protein